MEIKYILLVILFSLINVSSQIVLKFGTNSLQKTNGIDSAYSKIFGTPYFYIAITMQILGYALWIFILSKSRMTIANTLSSSMYIIFSLILGWAILGDKLTIVQILGFCLTLVGIVLITFPKEGINL